MKWCVLSVICSCVLLLPAPSSTFATTTNDGQILLQDLGGENWTASSQFKHISVSSKVPGSIYSDLMASRLIGDIYRDSNDINYRWVAENDWDFVGYFEVNPELASKKNIWLVAYGLDTVADVYLNGNHLGSTDNMFVRYRWNVAKIVSKNGANKLEVKFKSAVKYSEEQFLKSGYVIPPVGSPKAQNGVAHGNFIRKMQSSFSWDWGPAFPTQGIWKPIRLEAYDNFIIRSISVSTSQFVPNYSSNKSWIIDYQVHFEGALNAKFENVQLNFYVNGIRINSEPFNIETLRFDETGETVVGGLLSVFPNQVNIEPWYPNGMGNQTLYKFTAQAELPGTMERSIKTIRMGFRNVQIVQERLPATREAHSFYFKVNGRSMFSKGSNWIPAHVLHEKISPAYMEELLISAKLANMNMLRVWGGGIYEDDRFYELADELGILIWQDLMFACALYPTDSKFLATVSTEVRQQMRRLQHHPSIALWAGNNENEVALTSPWWPEVLANRAKLFEDYRKLYIEHIGRIAWEEDLGRPYLSSSPSNGVMSARQNYTSKDANSIYYGDVHHYVVKGNVWQWKMHPSAKFVSEYGFQSWSSLNTLRDSISSEELKYPFGKQLNNREHQLKGLDYLTSMIEENFELSPITNDTHGLEKYIYLSQVHQSMAIKLQTEFYRRNRRVNEDGSGMTMGALYWQLNDIWPTVSWASVEFGGKWKMLHYYARKMFDNCLVDAYLDDDQLLVAFTRDDYAPLVHFNLTVSIYSWASTTPLKQFRSEHQSQFFSSEIVFKQNLNETLSSAGCKRQEDCFVFVEAENADLGIKRDNFLLLVSPKDSHIQKNRVDLQQITGPQMINGIATFSIEFESTGIAPFVWIDFESNDIYGLFSENGFFMVDKRKTLSFQSVDKDMTAEKLAKSLKVTSLMNFY